MNRPCPRAQISLSAQSRREFLKTAGLGVAAMSLNGAGRADAQRAPKPDILVILVDDMGFSDIGCYGGEIRTPNLDALAANGVRFTNFYSTARCCPTRASLLTGLYAHQAGVGHMMEDKGFDGYRGCLNHSCVTIPEALKPAGYRAYMSGKWHVSRFTSPKGPSDHWPRQRGFDRFFGTLAGAGSYYAPQALMRDHEPIELPEGAYYTDAIAQNAADYITDHAAQTPDDPFFLYLAFTAPHWPLHAPEEDIARYRGKYLRGWDALRDERRERMTQMGLLRESWPLTPRDAQATAWADVDAPKRAEMDLRMATYAAQIDRMDQGVGRVVETLRRTGRLANTLIMFISDNGACAEGGPWGFERKEGGTIGQDSSFASYGLSWANASNTPFRLYKHWVHEGGIASPLIVHWPSRIPAKGEYRDQPGHVIDVMATCVDAAGADYPAQFNGNAITPLEGKSLVPALDDQPVEREAIYWEHEGNRAVRRGKWKLVSKHPGGWELYDLDADRTEMNDLSGERPEHAAQLMAMWEAWAKDRNVLVWPVKSDTSSDKREFELKQGDSLPRTESPNVAREAILISATISGEQRRGVIVAQGGTRVGYALYLEDRKLTFAVRHEGGVPATIVTTDSALPDGEVTVEARLAKNGAITLGVNGSQVASGKAPRSLTDTPTEGLDVGQDTGAPVGEYTAPNEFQGSIGQVRIRLGE